MYTGTARDSELRTEFNTMGGRFERGCPPPVRENILKFQRQFVPFQVMYMKYI